MKIDKNALIYIVEDDKALNTLLAKFLRMNGYKNIMSFYSGEECVEQLINKPAIVIQDFDLPGMNGLDVFKKSKEISPYSAFIFLSGQGDIKVAVEAIQLGAFDYIVKDNFAKENALNKINKLLRMKQLEKDKNNSRLGMYLVLAILILSWVLYVLFGFL